ncbi:hypothetical protein R1G71_10740 [Stenotrophomonas sp. C1657]|nr:hypothetical protein [Stenotrophomonas sp. C1657]MDV3515201.1 hypothetical protein [Stenotrophomonas sp. C1657]
MRDDLLVRHGRAGLGQHHALFKPLQVLITIHGALLLDELVTALYCCPYRRKHPGIDTPTVGAWDAHNESPGVHVDAALASGTSRPFVAIPGVLSVRNAAKVGALVIEGVAIDVVDAHALLGSSDQPVQIHPLPALSPIGIDVAAAMSAGAPPLPTVLGVVFVIENADQVA